MLTFQASVLPKKQKTKQNKQQQQNPMSRVPNVQLKCHFQNGTYHSPGSRLKWLVLTR